MACFMHPAAVGEVSEGDTGLFNTPPPPRGTRCGPPPGHPPGGGSASALSQTSPRTAWWAIRSICSVKRSG